MFLGRVVAPGQPEWLPEDRDKVIAYELEQDSLCPGGCGRPARESMARENQLKYRAEPIRCHACAERDRTKQAYDKREGSDDSGLFIRLTHGPDGPL